MQTEETLAGIISALKQKKNQRVLFADYKQTTVGRKMSYCPTDFKDCPTAVKGIATRLDITKLMVVPSKYNPTGAKTDEVYAECYDGNGKRYFLPFRELKTDPDQDIMAYISHADPDRTDYASHSMCLEDGTVQMHRKPTKGDILFGYGTMHYINVMAEFMVNNDGTVKQKANFKGLTYTR